MGCFIPGLRGLNRGGRLEGNGHGTPHHFMPNGDQNRWEQSDRHPSHSHGNVETNLEITEVERLRDTSAVLCG